MTAMRAIIDTWNQIEKHGIHGWKQIDSTTVLVPDAEYDRLLNRAPDQKYIRRLLNDTPANRKAGHRVEI